jgi:DNA mismatch repair ATPase MutS
MGNSMMGYLFNVLFLSHIKTSVKLERWKEKHQKDLPETIENIAEFESLLSVAVFAFEHPVFIYPQFENSSECLIEAKNIGHPLIPENKSIKNDFHLKSGEIIIITGANMAGKSTFLRTLGINLLLSYIGAPVCASHFRCSDMKLFTSMRMLDNLENGISYFYAEALRFKQLLSLIASGKNILFLIDELFKGTNSEDRLKSAEAFIRNLTTFSNTAGLIASHDLKITELEHEFPSQIHNFCFECTNADDVIHFDYLLRKGVTRTNNAYLLLKKLEVI